ncbi:hypothetical protein COU77_04275 [Candidatus Peregrinibacteria bacterium CG10_big_fil_rev_8_21_14_0_10_49_16]|nr:MAG: hypothetical protein COU77_04275 [Candidatus Peregrinibacteria bacterium CG10_big_fil_rev_8_21_14_0_10_49_16]
MPQHPLRIQAKDPLASFKKTPKSAFSTKTIARGDSFAYGMPSPFSSIFGSWRRGHYYLFIFDIVFELRNFIRADFQKK